ncbi:hypothetical protein ACEN8K_45360, partial [Variovorax sp. CT11-76]
GPLRGGGGGGGGGDRRQVRLGLTDSGQALYDELFPLVTAINAGLMGALDAGEAERFDAALHRLQERDRGAQQVHSHLLSPPSCLWL